MIPDVREVTHTEDQAEEFQEANWNFLARVFQHLSNGAVWGILIFFYCQFEFI